MSEKRETTKVGAVVVGVDGSPGAGEALRWALAEARLRKVPLRVVHAWTYGYAGATAGGYGNLGFIGSFDSPVPTPVILDERLRDARDGDRRGCRGNDGRRDRAAGRRGWSRRSPA